ncbi:Inner nuclear membrane Man1 [Cinnamomum micranthum f. kanehirae]|uniref:Inner nuclear membrane Man1 n=1 Tax=Cinnamomum micranthum f. kanehirae TaxID=337451 RepID=A0A3S3P1V2_9MAGN|nr:Inner nuclear membrane Man1 [Cinnamomum micranthum f. kanehirae]
MMSSNPQKRQKSRKREKTSSSPSPSFPFLKEPSPSLFPSKQDLLKLLTVIAIASFVAVACNYTVRIVNRKPKPFCDSSQDPLSDFCQPCPNNARCFQGSWDCLPGYKKHGKFCVEDGEINQTAEKLFEWVERHVCEAYARFLCSGTGTIWFREEDILKKIDENNLKDNSGFKNDTFMLSKLKATERIASSLERRADFNGIKEFKCPDLLADQYKPLLCCIRQWIYKNIIYVLPIFVALLGSVKLFRIIRRSQYLSTRAEELYEQVCDILEESALSAKSREGEGDTWVVASRLRDHLLLPRERKDSVLWKKVEELVQGDSRIDRYPKLVKGESRIVWEWQVEGSLSSRGRTKVAMSKLKSLEHKYESHSPLQRKLQVGELLNC